MAEPIPVGPERRRVERRTNPTLAELTLPELRKMMVTTILLVVIVVMLQWIVRWVIIATILGIIVALYLRPLYLRIMRAVPNKVTSATITLMAVIVPVLGLSAY